MEYIGRAAQWQWQRLLEDVLIVTSTTAIAVAAVGPTANVMMILVAAALIGVGLMLDRTELAEAQDAREHFDAALVDAASR